jgi:hypothetical protein
MDERGKTYQGTGVVCRKRIHDIAEVVPTNNILRTAERVLRNVVRVGSVLAVDVVADRDVVPEERVESVHAHELLAVCERDASEVGLASDDA